MVAAQFAHGVGEGQEVDGDYTIRHCLSLSGDWVFARRLMGFPGVLELRAEYSVSGPRREAAMELFVVRVMEDIVQVRSRGGGQAGRGGGGGRTLPTHKLTHTARGTRHTTHATHPPHTCLWPGHLMRWAAPVPIMALRIAHAPPSHVADRGGLVRAARGHLWCHLHREGPTRRRCHRGRPGQACAEQRGGEGRLTVRWDQGAGGGREGSKVSLFLVLFFWFCFFFFFCVLSETLRRLFCVVLCCCPHRRVVPGARRELLAHVSDTWSCADGAMAERCSRRWARYRCTRTCRATR
jgi:hypothetical protein